MFTQQIKVSLGHDFSIKHDLSVVGDVERVVSESAQKLAQLPLLLGEPRRRLCGFCFRLLLVMRLSGRFCWGLVGLGGSVCLSVFAADEEPDAATKSPSYPCCYVLNTDPKSEPGEHWLAFYRASSTSRTEYFDSMGLPRSFYGLPDGDFVEVNKSQLQSMDSKLCGQYCVYFLERRSFYKRPDQIIRNLVLLGQSREPFVKKHVQDMMTYPIRPVLCTHLTDPYACKQQSCQCVSCFCRHK